MHLPDTNPHIAISSTSLYETDFYAWTQEQVSLLHNQQWSQVDLENLIEEIASLGKQQRQELRNSLSILIGHLLKWEYQSQYRSRSWLATLRIQRLDTAELLEENPSLKPDLEAVLSKAYLKGVELAGELPRRKTDGASQFIGNSRQELRNSIGLTFPPRAGVLVPKTQIFFLQHIPISLVFACGIDGQDTTYLTRKFWGFVIHLIFVFATQKINSRCNPYPPLPIPTL